MTSPYPRDDFDAVDPPRDGRRGAHRAAPPRSHGVVAPLVVAAVVAVAGVAGWFALDLGGGSAAAASTASAPAGAADGTVEGSADGTVDGEDGAAVDAAPSAAASSAPAAEVDRSTPVVVLNGTGTKGLAATRAATVEAAGWTVSSTGNATTAQRSAHTSTAVLYRTADLEAAATSLAAEVGGTAALDASATAATLTVVLR